MGTDAATVAKGAPAGSGSSSGLSCPSAISQAKALAKAQDEATTQEPVQLASVRRPTTGARVHALPCTIVHDGPAAVSTYFLPKRAGGSQGVRCWDARFSLLAFVGYACCLRTDPSRPLV